ncbi:MAG: hybrid sensor histidine kinase/response regulator [Alphaproteobacteria bacterium]|nr:hybrid sensor histidine kinase/response regulator [Alphaproteobacteria bacterium]
MAFFIERPSVRARPYTWLLAASAIVPLLLLVAVSWSDRLSLLDDTDRNVRQTADIFFHQALNVFETHELIAERVSDRIRDLTWDEIASSEAVRQDMMAFQRDYEQVRGIWLVDPSGDIRAASRTLPASPVSVADRTYFKTLRERDIGTFISQVGEGRVLGGFNFNVARRRSSATGTFDGVVAVSVTPSYFTDFWRKTKPSADSVVELLQSDGAILARDPAAPPGLVRIPFQRALEQALSRGESRSFRAVSPVDGIERIYAMRKVGNFDAYLLYGVAVEAVLRQWYMHLAIDGAYFSLAALVLVAMTLAVLRQSRREQIATDHWHATARQASEEMERRLAAEAQLHQSQKIEALGKLTGGVAHDFNNLLTVIIGNLERLRSHQVDARHEKMVGAALAAAERGERSLQALLAFARNQPLEIRELDLNAIVRAIAGLVRQCVGDAVELVLSLDPKAWPVAADRNQLELAIVNLAVNARDAMPAGGVFRIATADVHIEGTPNGLVGDFVTLAVSDTGIGMPSEIAEKVFEPFFTTKEAGKGTGLGLSQVYGFVTQCQGTVTVSSVAGEGTTFTLYLPRVSDPRGGNPADRSSLTEGARAR